MTLAAARTIRHRVPSTQEHCMTNSLPCDALSVDLPILGIDASVAKIGFCVAWRNNVRAWVYRPKHKGVARMREVRDEIHRIIRQNSISRAAIEGYSFSSRNSHSHATGEIGGILRLILSDLNVHTIAVPPTTLKKFLSGKGNTPKTGMPLALYKQYHVEYADEDQCDATALAIIGAAYFGGHKRKLLQYQADALQKASLIWPT